MPEKLTKPVRRVYVDTETGQQHVFEHEEPLRKRVPKISRTKEPFFMGFPEAMPALLSMPLTQTDLRVVLALLGTMAFEEEFPASPTELASMLDTNKGHIARSLRHLKDLGVLIEKGRGMVMVNPHFFWRGSVAARVGLLSASSSSSS